jgi:hypothetical protein
MRGPFVKGLTLWWHIKKRPERDIRGYPALDADGVMVFDQL